MKVVFRAIQREDMPVVIRLLNENLSPFEPPIEEYSHIWSSYKNQNNVFGVVASIDKNIVGYGSLVIEVKIRGGILAHIEDIVCASSYRGKGIGGKIIETLLIKAQELNAYKIALACQPNKESFYKKNGFMSDGISMSRLV